MTLDEAREGVGRTVIYSGGREPEEGTITSVSAAYVFVHYPLFGSSHGVATDAELIEFAHG